MGDINVGDEENNEDDEDEDDDDVDLDDSLEDNLNDTVEENALLQHSIDHDNLTHGSHSANISLQDVIIRNGAKTISLPNFVWET
jgi:hypothetical protein